MVSVGASEDFLTSMMNKEKKQNNDIEYYSALSFHARGQKLGDIYLPLANFQFTPFSPFSAMPAILHLSHHLPGDVLQPGSGGFGGILLHRPLLCSSLNSPEWNFPLDVVGWGECCRPGKPLPDPAAARPRLFVHASFQDYP